MGIEEYYLKTKEGDFLLHFPNFHGYSQEQIVATFSRFGLVTGVDLKGQTHGLCFVRYASEREAIDCINGLSRSSSVKILKHKSKTKSNDSQQNNQVPNKSKSNKQQASTSKQNQQVPKGWHKGQHKGQQQHVSNGPKPKITIPSLMDINPRVSDSKSHSRANSVIGDSASVVSMCSMRNDSVTLSEKNLMLAMTKSASNWDIQAGIESGENNKIQSDDIGTGSVAEDVIVANIQSSYGIHYILHMFQKFGPICVRQMKTIPQTNIRYCIVYFRTLQAAQCVQDEFDNFPLGGRNLIVLRSKSLISKVKLL